VYGWALIIQYVRIINPSLFKCVTGRLTISQEHLVLYSVAGRQEIVRSKNSGTGTWPNVSNALAFVIASGLSVAEFRRQCEGCRPVSCISIPRTVRL
jgi:hypothetical protein